MENFCVKVKSLDRKNDISATMMNNGRIELYVKHHGESILASVISLMKDGNGDLRVRTTAISSTHVGRKDSKERYESTSEFTFKPKGDINA